MANGMPRAQISVGNTLLTYETFGFLPKYSLARRLRPRVHGVQRRHTPPAGAHNSVTIRRGFDGEADGSEGTSILDPLRTRWRRVEGDGRRDERWIQERSGDRGDRRDADRRRRRGRTGAAAHAEGLLSAGGRS